jgi:hypothetical protein
MIQNACYGIHSVSRRSVCIHQQGIVNYFKPLGDTLNQLQSKDASDTQKGTILA